MKAHRKHLHPKAFIILTMVWISCTAWGTPDAKDDESSVENTHSGAYLDVIHRIYRDDAGFTADQKQELVKTTLTGFYQRLKDFNKEPTFSDFNERFISGEIVARPMIKQELTQALNPKANPLPTSDSRVDKFVKDLEAFKLFVPSSSPASDTAKIDDNALLKKPILDLMLAVGKGDEAPAGEGGGGGGGGEQAGNQSGGGPMGMGNPGGNSDKNSGTDKSDSKNPPGLNQDQQGILDALRDLTKSNPDQPLGNLLPNAPTWNAQNPSPPITAKDSPQSTLVNSATKGPIDNPNAGGASRTVNAVTQPAGAGLNPQFFSAAANTPKNSPLQGLSNVLGGGAKSPMSDPGIGEFAFTPTDKAWTEDLIPPTFKKYNTGENPGVSESGENASGAIAATATQKAVKGKPTSTFFDQVGYANHDRRGIFASLSGSLKKLQGHLCTAGFKIQHCVAKKRVKLSLQK